MKRASRLTALTPVLLLLVFGSAASPPAPTTASADKPTCLAVSDGGGLVRLLWPVPETFWPAGGWQILDENGRVLKTVGPGEAAAVTGLTKEEADFVQTFAKGLPAFKSDQERQTYFFALKLSIFIRPAFARAAGFSAVLEGIPAGLRTYRIQGVSGDRNPV